MKKIILAVTVLFSLGVAAQDFGIKVGANLPSFSNQQKVDGKFIDAENKGILGFYVGITYEQFITDNISIDADVLYNTFSQDIKLGLERTEEFNTLSIPISLNYYPIEKLKIGAGASVNFNIDSKAEYKYRYDIVLPNPDDNPSLKNNTHSQYNKTYYSIHFAASFNIWHELYIDARYNLGFGNMYKDEDNWSEYSKLKYNNLQLGLSYKF